MSRQIKNLQNIRFGKLVVMRATEERRNGKVVWECRCDCGNKTLVASDKLKSKRKQSCGCLKNQDKLKDITGRRFGNLIAVKLSGEKSGSARLWLCKCDCGEEAKVSTSKLISGNTKSCGCLNRKYDKMRVSKMKQSNVDLLEDGTNIALIKSQKISRNNTSGVRGVFWCKRTQKWGASIGFQRKQKDLGRFSEKSDAIRVRKEAEEKYYKPILEKEQKKD